MMYFALGNFTMLAIWIYSKLASPNDAQMTIRHLDHVTHIYSKSPSFDQDLLVQFKTVRSIIKHIDKCQ